MFFYEIPYGSLKNCPEHHEQYRKFRAFDQEVQQLPKENDFYVGIYTWWADHLNKTCFFIDGKSFDSSENAIETIILNGNVIKPDTDGLVDLTPYVPDFEWLKEQIKTKQERLSPGAGIDKELWWQNVVAVEGLKEGDHIAFDSDLEAGLNGKQDDLGITGIDTSQGIYINEEKYLTSDRLARHYKSGIAVEVNGDSTAWELNRTIDVRYNDEHLTVNDNNELSVKPEIINLKKIKIIGGPAITVNEEYDEESGLLTYVIGLRTSGSIRLDAQGLYAPVPNTVPGPASPTELGLVKYDDVSIKMDDEGKLYFTETPIGLKNVYPWEQDLDLKALKVGRDDLEQTLEDFGYDAPGRYSFQEGDHTLGAGDSAHAEGTSTLAGGLASHSEGYTTSALGEYSHSEGHLTKATNTSAHAEGENTQATGKYAHAEGIDTLAEGIASHAEGFNTIAYGNYSHASGNSTIARAHSQFVTGKFNKQDLEGRYAFLVGIGLGELERRNGFGVDWEGNLHLPEGKEILYDL